jgi:enamine deaminase RidA (YjgF/YER057c/UK114 family)
MSKPEFFVVPGAGDIFRKELHFSSAVKIGDRIETSGQGGWNDSLQIPEKIEDEIAAATWAHVVHVNTYHVGGFPPIVNETIVKLYRQYMPNHAPIWTQVGIEELGLPTMRFEIRVTAIVQ